VPSRTTLESSAAREYNDTKAVDPIDGRWMQNWQAVVAIVHERLDRSAMFLSDLPPALLLALLLLPIVLVIFSRNIVLGLICLTMVFTAGLIFIAPADAALILAIALYVGSVFASLMGIISRRRKRDDLQFYECRLATSWRPSNEGSCSTPRRLGNQRQAGRAKLAARGAEGPHEANQT
jgi:hypothetical protein